MLTEQTEEMFNNYRELITHLTEEKDNKGLELIEKLLVTSHTLIDNIIDVHYKLMEGRKNAK